MATILQQQLAAIAAKSTHQLDLRAQRTQHSKSLLFEPRVAAGQSLETIYHICLDGYQELCMLDARYKVFADNLFSPQSKDEDRTQMSSQENQDLDATIHRFLRLVSGKLLLSPAQKAIEWLVRRFAIHEYNTEYFILSFLPYHTNDIFPTVLSILPKQIPAAYRFLQPYIATLACPPRHAILNSTVNGPTLFSAISQYTLAAAKQRHHSAILVGFWASITAQSVHGQLEAAQSGRADIMKQRQEDVLLRVLPILQEAFALRDIPEIYLGACMIVTILVAKARLEDTVLDSLMDAIALGWSSQTIDDGLVCLSVIAAERSSRHLPSRTTKGLLRVSDLSGKLAKLSVDFTVGQLYQCLAVTLIERRRLSGSKQIVMNMFELESIDDIHKENVARAILRNALGSHTLDDPETFTIVQQLAETNRLILDSALSAEHINIKELEARISQVLDHSALPAIDGPDDGDIDMVGNADAASAEDTSIQDLELLTTAMESKTDAFGQVSEANSEQAVNAFLRLARSKTGIAHLTSCAAFSDKKTLSSPNPLCHLARVWSHRNVPATARLAAIKIAGKIVTDNADLTIDMQSLLPYLISAMSDDVAHIRRAVAEVLLAIVNLYHVSSAKGKLAKDLNIWGQGKLYTSSSTSVKVHDLSSQDAYKILTTVIAPVIEECILDPSHLARVLVKAINAVDSDASLKTAVRTSFHNFLCSHAVLTPLLGVRSNLLAILDRIGKAGSSGRVHILIPAIRDWGRLADAARDGLCAEHGLDRAHLDVQLLSCLGGKYPDEIACLRDLTSDSDTSPAFALLAFARLTRVWPSIRPQTQSEAVMSLLHQALGSASSDELVNARQSAAKVLLRDVSMSTDALSMLLDSIPDMAQMTEKQPTVKRRRTSKTEGSRTQAVNAAELHKVISQLTLVLEIVEANKPEKHTDLLKNLFRILSELQNYRIQLGSDLVYLQQMVIGSLLAIVNVLKDSSDVKADRSILRTDLIVECVRSTSSTVVHNSALLLISSLASWVPDLVLHSVMPIFTFMSTTILRQSDDYSAHIIDQTVSRVVPPLIKSLRKRNQDLVLGASELLLSFTAAFEHIPIHRRLRLFSHLVEAIGPDESLAAIVAMLSEKYPTDYRVPQFVADLCGQFSPLTQLKASITYLDLVGDALQPRRVVTDAVFALSDKSPEQVDASIETLLTALAQLLQQKQLHDQVEKSLKQDAAQAEQIETVSATLLERALGLAQSVTARAPLISACGSIVASCLGLLPTPHFVRSALPLLERDDDRLGQMILQSFEKRSSKTSLSDNSTRSAMLQALPAICGIITGDRDSTLKHSAVRCVDHITERYGKKDIEAVLAAVRTIVSKDALGSQDAGMQINSLLCLATMVATLGEDMVVMLPKTIERTLELIAGSIETQNKQLHNAGFSFLCAVLDRLSFALSARALKQTLCLCFEAAAQPDIAAAGAESRALFATLASSKVELRTWLKALHEVVDTATDSGEAGCRELLTILRTIVSSLPSSAVVKRAFHLLAVIQQTFDYRRVLSEKNGSTDEATLASLDNDRDTILLDVIMKMNDKVFRPHFVTLLDYAQQEPASFSSSSQLRRTSFYTFLARFFETLKSIVTSYTSYVLDDATLLLASTPQTTHDAGLVTAVLAALTASFKHDQEDFFQAPDTFKRVSEALLARLHSSCLSDPATAAAAGAAAAPSNHIIEPCMLAITELAAASSSTEQHAALNSSLLKWTRSGDARLRLVAVQCELRLTDRLGEDWLAVLPEMLPFISELQEDEDEGVERETLRWIKAMEGILGESLDGMLQ